MIFIGVLVVGISSVLFLIGIAVVMWDWTVRSDPDAPHGGPIVAIAIVGLLCGGVVSCVATVHEVMEMKAQNK